MVSQLSSMSICLRASISDSRIYELSVCLCALYTDKILLMSSPPKMEFLNPLDDATPPLQQELSCMLYLTLSSHIEDTSISQLKK